jgi:hypothetical protein
MVHFPRTEKKEKIWLPRKKPSIFGSSGNFMAPRTGRHQECPSRLGQSPRTLKEKTKRTIFEPQINANGH